MKRALWFSFGLLWLVGSFVHAQTNYTIDWFTIDGGGGTTTGGVFSVAGTIGQADAGAMSGGSFTVEGGFWGVMAVVQTVGAPSLSIFRTSTNTVAVTWSSSSTGWILQQTTNNLSSAEWSNVTAPVPDDGTNRTYIITPPTGNRFYRLRKP